MNKIIFASLLRLDGLPPCAARPQQAKCKVLRLTLQFILLKHTYEII